MSYQQIGLKLQHEPSMPINEKLGPIFATICMYRNQAIIHTFWRDLFLLF